jgi:hypothetical protein
VIFAVSGLCAAAQSQTGGADAAVPDILSAIRQREGRVASVYYTWDTKRTVAGESQALGEGPSGTGQSGPQADTVVTERSTLLMAGQRIRVRQMGEAWDERLGEFVPVNWEAVWKPGEQVSFFTDDRKANRADFSTLIQDAEFQAPMLAHGLLHLDLPWPNIRDSELVGWVEFNGHRCAVFEQHLTGFDDDVGFRIWLARDMEYSPIACDHMAGQRGIVFQVRMQYEPSAVAGWRLSSWTIAGRTSSSQYTVTQAVFNRPTTDADFEIALPPGTSVYDEIEGREYTVAGDGAPADQADEDLDAFIEGVEKDTPRPVAAADARPVGRRSTPAAPPQTPIAAAAEGSHGKWLLPAGIALAVLLAAACYLAVRGRQRTA